jgi:hypothetical protein
VRNSLALSVTPVKTCLILSTAGALMLFVTCTSRRLAGDVFRRVAASLLPQIWQVWRTNHMQTAIDTARGSSTSIDTKAVQGSPWFATREPWDAVAGRVAGAGRHARRIEVTMSMRSETCSNSTKQPTKCPKSGPNLFRCITKLSPWRLHARHAERRLHKSASRLLAQNK